MPVRLNAQADTGRIAGVVKDPSDAVIPGVKINCTQTETGASQSTTSAYDGSYTFPSLHTGTYTIRVEGQGFTTAVKDSNVLNDGGQLTVNFILRPGSSEQVIVTSQVGDTVNTQSGEVSHVIDGETVRDIALNGRNYLDLLGTLPGSVVTSLGDAIASTTSNTTTNINLNGARATANGIYLDGTVNKDVAGNDRQFNNVGIDFIEHVRVQTSAFSAQYGTSAGPAVNVVTRSGTNTLHGSLFEYIRNNIFDATNYFSRKAIAPNGIITGYTAIPQHLRFNDFGGAIGGPLIRNKLFFFMGTESKLIAQRSTPVQNTLPLQSQLNGNFCTVSNANGSCKTCPLTNLPGLNTATCDLAMSGLISPFGRSLQQLYNNFIAQASSYVGAACSATGCSNNNNTIYSLPQPYRIHEYLARVDWNITSRQNMYARWVDDVHTTTNPVGDGSLPDDPYHDEGPAHNVILSHTYVVSPNAFNEINFATLWNSVNQTAYGTSWLRNSYGFDYTPLYPNSPGKLGIPSISIAGYSGSDSEAYLNFAHATYLQVQDVLTKVAGRHSLKFGLLEGRNREDKDGNPRDSAGTISFTTTNNSFATTGNALADALLGRYYSYTEEQQDTYGFFRLWQTAAFVDDIWRATAHLSINAGMRYERITPWISQQNNVATFYPELYDPAKAVTVNSDGTVVPGSGDINNGMRRAEGGVPQSEQFRVPSATASATLAVPATAPRGFYPVQNTFAPRFGFAYDLNGNGQTAFRGGGGLFYDLPAGSAAYTALNTPPYNAGVQVFGCVTCTVDNLSVQSSTRQGAHPDMYTIDPHSQRTYVYQYNFGLQQQLTKGFFLEINYIGAEGRHLLRDPDINGVDPLQEETALKANPSANFTSLRPYKGYGAIYQYRTDSDYNYNGLQATLARRAGKVGRFTFNYTWAKSLATASADGSVAHILIWSRSFYYGPTTFDRRNVINGTYIGQFPELRKQSPFLRTTFGSWLLSLNGRYQSGEYLTETGTDSVTNVTSRANYSGLPIQYHHSANNWYYTINPGGQVVFSPPITGQIGNAPVGNIIGPNFVNVDVSMRKAFALPHNFRLAVQLDSFNVFNHPTLSVPGANVNGQTSVEVNGVVDHAYEYVNSAGRARDFEAAARLTF
jgi:hypothetical protein